MAHMVYISADGDNIGHLIGSSALNDQEEELIQIANKINQGEQLLIDFASSSGGKLISSGGDEARLVIPAEAANKIPDLREQYQNVTGASISMGLGMSLSQAEKALIAAKLRGKDQIVMYDDSVESDLSKLHETPEDEKVEQNYFNDQQIPNNLSDVIEPEPTQDVANNGSELDEQLADVNQGIDTHTLDGQLEMIDEDLKNHSIDGQLDNINQKIGEPAPEEQQDNIQDILAQMSPPDEVQPDGQQESDGQEVQPEEGQPSDQPQDASQPVSVLELIANTLMKVKEHASFIEGLKTANPKAYEAIKGIVQAMLAMSHELMGPNDAQQDSEGQPQPQPDSGSNASSGGGGSATQVRNHRVSYPPGTVINGRKKVLHNDGSTGWISVRSGELMGEGGGRSSRTTRQDLLHVK